MKEVCFVLASRNSWSRDKISKHSEYFSWSNIGKFVCKAVNICLQGKFYLRTFFHLHLDEDGKWVGHTKDLILFRFEERDEFTLLNCDKLSCIQFISFHFSCPYLKAKIIVRQLKRLIEFCFFGQSCSVFSAKVRTHIYSSSSAQNRILVFSCIQTSMS